MRQPCLGICRAQRAIYRPALGMGQPPPSSSLECSLCLLYTGAWARDCCECGEGAGEGACEPEPEQGGKTLQDIWASGVDRSCDKCFTHIHLQQPYEVAISVPVLQLRTPCLREVKQLAQNHTASVTKVYIHRTSEDKRELRNLPEMRNANEETREVKQPAQGHTV